MKVVLLVALAGCGRLQFDELAISDGATDVATPRFCTQAASRIPTDAQASLCMDFEDVALGPVADATFLVPGRLHARGRTAFTRIEITTAGIAGTHAFHYQPAPSSVCDNPSDMTCCYADLYLDFGELMFTSHAHFEYDHYLETTPVTNIGAYFWGGLYFPYTETFVTPALGTGHWYHVAIDGDVGTNPLVITVDGVELPNMAGTNNLMAGIQGAVGTFCDDVTASGYIDNLMFWGR